MKSRQHDIGARAVVAGAALVFLSLATTASAQQASALAAASATAASAGVVENSTARITEYMGGGYLTLSEDCADYGWTGTHQVMIRMQPQGLPGNLETESQLALFFATGVIAMKYNYDDKDRSGVTPITEASYVWNGPYIPEEPTMTINFTRRYGAYLPNGEQFLDSLFIEFGNFNEHEDCTARLRVSAARMP